MSSKKPIVLCDVDGVVASFEDKFIEVTNFVLGTSFTNNDLKLPLFHEALGLTREQELAVKDELAKLGVADELKPYPDAVEGIKELAKISNIYFVTSIFRRCPTWTFDRVKWLKEYLGEELSLKTVFTFHKELVQGDVFIDDLGENIFKWAQANKNGNAILFMQNYNKDVKIRGEKVPQDVQDRTFKTNSWKTIYNFVNSF